MLFLFLDTSVNIHGFLSICFCSKESVKPTLVCGGSDIQSKIALVVAKFCSPFRTIQKGLL